MTKRNNPSSEHTENAGAPEMVAKMLRIDHQWMPYHARTYLEDGKTYTIQLKNGATMHDAIFHRDPLFDKHWFTVGGIVYPIEEVCSHSIWLPVSALKKIML